MLVSVCVCVPGSVEALIFAQHVLVQAVFFPTLLTTVSVRDPRLTAALTSDLGGVPNSSQSIKVLMQAVFFKTDLVQAVFFYNELWCKLCSSTMCFGAGYVFPT